MTDPEGFTTSQEYDAFGRVLTYDDQKSERTTYGYDGTHSQPTSILHPDGATEQFEYNLWGLPTKTIDELGHETVNTYRDNGLLEMITDANGGETAFTYDNRNQLETITDPVGNTTTYAYDDAGRVVQEIGQLGGQRSYEYDAADRLTRVTDRNGRVREFTYDRVGNVTEQRWYDDTGSLVRTTGTSYDEVYNLTHITDPRASAY
ncbi:hypothetical protein [Kolteria novifilia]|uniref:hypothetical protein n=1 Tax=Kolteria novifilia TaxID=2527975 RepID=UPI003AF335A6